MTNEEEQTSPAMTEEDKAAVAAATNTQAPEEPNIIALAPCPCGRQPQNLVIEMPQRAKYGRASGDCCAEWSVEFRNGYSDDPQLTQERAVKAWNEAPRAGAD